MGLEYGTRLLNQNVGLEYGTGIVYWFLNQCQPTLNKVGYTVVGTVVGCKVNLQELIINACRNSTWLS